MADISTIDDLKARRREQEMKTSDDARKWTPLDVLKMTIQDIENGTINPDMIYICMRETRNPNVNDHSEHHFRCSGVDRLQAIGLLSRHMHLAQDVD